MSSYWEYQIHTIEDENSDVNNKHGKPRKVKYNLWLIIHFVKLVRNVLGIGQNNLFPI